MSHPFEGFDLDDFWSDEPYARRTYEDLPLTDAMVAEVEADLGVRLPASYVALMKHRNGGCPARTCFPTSEPTSWADDHIAITGLAAIGRRSNHALCGKIGSRFMQREWGYPEFGICIADCPSAGHDMVMLDYRECGPDGEPQVIHVDQELDFAITFLAKDFETFVRGLVDQEDFDESAELLEQARIAVSRGSFSSNLAALVAASGRESTGPRLRRLASEIVEEKGFFALHADPKSWLVYDLLFHLHSSNRPAPSRAEYLQAYPELLVFGDGAFSTGGYGPQFVENWFDARRESGDIVDAPGAGLRFSEGAIARLENELLAYDAPAES